ncbi:type VII secretion protein EccE [Mycobacterium asiaticum]|uniref:Type VII secretion protein EccE n=1 Tax=Mycobacterium asiaticum TaxID=1790 RepID=A0A1A3N5I4_MYCAS|nr:type VII secretion protein EccE [Mycobacterium asiaticum]OBK15632.1 type VII secretion protein EccE [Mycobacterium asiaticum]
MLGSIPSPGPARVSLALLAVVPAAMAYPWHSTRAYCLLGIAVAVLILLFGWWRGLHFTTILRRRLAILGRSGRPVPEPDSNTRTTALLRIGSAPSASDVLPLPLIAGYLDRYGVRADSIRITSRDTASGAAETWVGLTISAAANLPALQARSSRIPLHETAEVVARRLGDHLREIGWEAGTVGSEDVPEVLAWEPDKSSRETWRSVRQGDSDYVAAYRITADSALPETLAAVRSQSAREIWTAVEIARSGAGSQHTVAAACALRTDTAPDRGVPVPGLTLERGNQRPALQALDPLSTRRLAGHTEAPAGLLEGLDWPTPAAGSHRAPLSEAETQVLTRT